MRALLGVLLLFGCDSKATATDNTGGVRTEQKSKEYESCGATSHCQDDLRCFEHSCRRTARSAVGDYHAALGAQLGAAGDLEESIAAYGQAVRSYETDKLALPPDVDCAYGAALARAKANKDHGELGARVLHRCILAVPPGSALRFTAMKHLATLHDAGLEPGSLRGAKLADRYLTRGPSAPDTDKLQITVTPTPIPTGKNWSKVPEAIIRDLKPGLIACWEKHNAATKKAELTVSIGLKIAYYSNPDFEDEGGWSTKLEAGTTEPEVCVKTVLEPAIKGLKLSESTNTRMAITIK